MQINSQFLIKASFKSLNWRLLQKQGERDIYFENIFCFNVSVGIWHPTGTGNRSVQ